MTDRKAPRIKQRLDPESEAWKAIPWRKLEQHVFRIQKRIYRASQQGKTRTVQKLQKLLMKSEAARLLAVRRVTQDNQGKKTAGVDGVKSIQPAQRFVMAQQIHPNQWKRHKTRPVRRVWIPKPGKAERRPLGIPVMLERAQQALVKSALEPEWEARFEGNSYGFRPGRSAHDAIVAIWNALRYKAKFVLDADISGCFDAINQEELLKKLRTFPQMRQIIKAWLKAGVIDNDVFTPTEAGTPQGSLCKALHKPPYAKQVTMQRDVRKTLILGHFRLNFLCIVSDDGFEIVLNSLSGDHANAPTNAQRPAPGSISPSWNTTTDLISWVLSLSACQELCKGNRTAMPSFQAFLAIPLHSLPLCIRRGDIPITCQYCFAWNGKGDN